MIKVTMKHAAIGNVQMEFDSFAELFEKSVLLSQMPEKCDKCGGDVALLFKNVTAAQGPRKGTKMKYYGLRCTSGHEYYLGIHNDDSRELFAYTERKFQDPYSSDQLANAEPREVCPHCKTSNQFHAKDCPNYTAEYMSQEEREKKLNREGRTDPNPGSVYNSTAKTVSMPTEAPGGQSGASAGNPLHRTSSDAPKERTPIQQARDKFVKSVGDLGLSMGNIELAKMLMSMHGWETLQTPLTVAHWEYCFDLCNQYKTAAEIGGINLDPNALAVMLGTVNGDKNIEDCNAAEWKAAAERAMEG